MKNIIPKTIIFTLILFLILTITPLIHAVEKGFELPDGATARLGKGRIYSMRYTEDGTRLALATSMGVWLYDTINFTDIYLLKKHRRYAHLMAFSPDGKILATADRSGEINFWDTDTGKHELELRNHNGVTRIIFGNDRNTFITLGGDGTLRIWDINTWEEQHVFEELINYSAQRIFSTAVSPNSFSVVAGDETGIVSIYDPISDTKTHELKGLEGIVSPVAFSSDDNYVVASNFENICWWDTDKKEIKHLIDEPLYVSALTFSPEDSLIASGCLLGDIRLWDVATGEQRQKMIGHTAQVIDLAFSSDLRTVASTSVDGSVRIWEVFSGKELHVFDGHFGNFTCIGVSPDSKTIATPTEDRTVCIWDIESGKVTKTFNKEGYFGVAEVVFNPSKNMIATASYGNFISLWDRDTDEHLTILRGHKDHVFSADFSPDGKTLVTGSKDTTVRIWDVDTLEVKHVLHGHDLAVMSVVFSPDGTTFASGGMDTIVKVWDASTGTEKYVLEGHELGVLCVAYSPDGSNIASVADTETIMLWHVATAESSRTIVDDGSDFTSVVFHPSGKVLATGSGSGEVQIFDFDSGESLHKFSGHLKKVTDLAFVSDGDKLVSRSEDGVLYVWDISTR